MKQLSGTKIELLNLLWRRNKPLSVRDMAEETGLKAQSVNMHLINMRRRSYVESAGRGLYSITSLGKEILGLPKIDSKKAKKILAPVPENKEFRFYRGIGKPLGISSSNLKDFSEKIREIDLKSIEFHMSRGDFEIWVHFLGDAELAKRLRLLRESNMTGKDLRRELYHILRSRCEELEKIAVGT